MSKGYTHFKRQLNGEQLNALKRLNQFAKNYCWIRVGTTTIKDWFSKVEKSGRILHSDCFPCAKFLVKLKNALGNVGDAHGYNLSRHIKQNSNQKIQMLSKSLGPSSKDWQSNVHLYVLSFFFLTSLLEYNCFTMVC